ncbi:MAG: flagellar brake protein [Rubrivivax sp.]
MGAQSFLDTMPALLDKGTEADPWLEFRVDSAAEVLAALRQLRDSSVALNLTPAGAESQLGATLWAIDTAAHRLSFSVADGTPALQTLATAGSALAVCYQESVKLQFPLTGLAMVQGARSSALVSAIPPYLYRFQRRGELRVHTDPRQSPRALGRHPAVPGLSVALRVLDVSVGGCGLHVPPETPPIRLGSVLRQLRIELDTEARFVATLVVRHQSEIRGGGGVRLGCEWEDLDATGLRVLRRYIEMMQRRRWLLSLS